jgi:hypothetical protein
MLVVGAFSSSICTATLVVSTVPIYDVTVLTAIRWHTLWLGYSTLVMLMTCILVPTSCLLRLQRVFGCLLVLYTYVRYSSVDAPLVTLWIACQDIDSMVQFSGG